MKIHYLAGAKIACCAFLPYNAMMTINKRLVTCLKCRKSKAFKGITNRKRKRKTNEYQPGLFE